MKLDLAFDPPWMNAAGSLGFAPDRHGPVDLARLGAFVSHPISLEKRSPAHGARYLAYPGGFLLHTGYPNPGLRAAIRRYGVGWGRSPVPVLVHLLCQRVDELSQAVQRLEGLPGVAGLELGLPPEIEVYNPSPVPPLPSFVEKKGSVIRSSTSLDMPAPSSLTLISTIFLSRLHCAEMRTLQLLFGRARSTFMTRLMNTCSSF